ncbi:MAG: replication-relaxation family protein [Patescibacteria group bacterium]
MTNQTITTKQEEILTLIYKYKFLNRIQIQSFLKHKDHRRINSWLKDLSEKEYLKRIWSNGYAERTRPSIYYLAHNSLNFLSKQYFITPKYFPKITKEAEAGPSEHYITDSILLADLGLAFLNKNKEAANSSAITKTELVEPYSEYSFLAEAKIKPELLFAKRVSNKSMTRYYLLEVIERYASFILVRNKIKRYFDLYYSNDWEDNMDGDFPTVLFVCHSMYLLIYAKRYARRIRADEYPDADFTIQFALLENIKSNESGSDIWEKA